MQPGKIIIFGIILWVFLLLEKYVFFQVLGFSASWMAWVYYILMIFSARVISRRLGVINFIEAIFSALAWLVMVLLLDSLVAKRFLDGEVFRASAYWWSFFAVFAAVFFLHKKRHVYVRKLLNEKHGHH